MEQTQQIGTSEQIKMEEKKWYEGLTAAEIERVFAERERKNYEELVAPIITAAAAETETETETEKPFHTKNIFPTSVFAADSRFYTSKFQTCCFNPTTHHGINRELFMGYVLKKGKKITQSQLDRINETDPEMKRFYVGTTILTVSQTTAYQSNQDNYEDITARIDRQTLRYNFKDRIPKGKHVFAVLVPTRSNPNFKNCPNYDIPYKAPVMMRPTDRGAIWMPNGAAFAMNPLGDAIIVLKD